MQVISFSGAQPSAKQAVSGAKTLAQKAMAAKPQVGMKPQLNADTFKKSVNPASKK
ncbi:hypothetical protein [Vampirovibrio sp.]|uniref:hypothetical protein n=1 Tax=Vampirovibrio sp. TaxID=2717857 RepID=UPI0035940DEC